MVLENLLCGHGGGGVNIYKEAEQATTRGGGAARELAVVPGFCAAKPAAIIAQHRWCHECKDP